MFFFFFLLTKSISTPNQIDVIGYISNASITVYISKWQLIIRIFFLKGHDWRFHVMFLTVNDMWGLNDLNLIQVGTTWTISLMLFLTMKQLTVSICQWTSQQSQRVQRPLFLFGFFHHLNFGPWTMPPLSFSLLLWLLSINYSSFSIALPLPRGIKYFLMNLFR